MWTKEHSKFYPNVSIDAIWKILIDINNWPNWHENLEYCKLEGELKVGNHFMLKPKGVPAVKIEFTEVNEKQSFTDCTKFFGAKMYHTHSMKVKDDGVLLSSKLVVTGPLKWLWIKLVAQKIASSIPHEMDTIVNLARKEDEKKS